MVIIENYALRAIGSLSDDKAAGVGKIVQRVWGGDDDWMATVRAQLNWQPTVDDSIREN